MTDQTNTQKQETEHNIVTEVLDNVGGAVAIAGTLLLRPFVREWYNTWGADEEERFMELPGDEFCPSPMQEFTRAITIQAPPKVIWPWLAQLGKEKGGLYSYELLENLIGCGIHNADQIKPEWQQVNIGDAVRLGPEGFPLYKVVAVTPFVSLVMVGADAKTGEPFLLTDPLPEAYTNAVWIFYLKPIDEHTTRLIMRGRLSYAPINSTNRLLWDFVTEPISFVMMRRMLLGIRERAEADAANS